GGPPRELEIDAIATLVRIGGRAGAQVAVDTHGPALPAAVRAEPALVKINRYEAADLLELPHDTDLRRLAEGVAGLSRGLVVLTDAHRGALALDGSIAYRASLPDVHGHYPVGSGDAFLGGLLTELDRGASLVEGLRTAVAAGAANALVPGPGRFAADTVAELRRQVQLDQRN
ncbi:MAG TPA: PfkB family carbohydrate kinase, partial [Microlunatus sp.]